MSESTAKKPVIKISPLLLICVVLPTLISIIYYGFVASDIYTSESHFIIRSPEKPSSGILDVALSTAGFASSQDDAHLINDYILSRDALRILNETIDVRTAYTADGIDFYSRFNGLGLDGSFEALHRYYGKQIGMQIDSVSSIATLTVRAFTPEVAHKINVKLLDLSESLINSLNERGRQDLIRFAQAEVDAAEARALDASLAVSRYRDSKGVVDPEMQAGIQLQQVSELQKQLIEVKGKLAQLRSFAHDNPQIQSLQKTAQTLREAIATEQAKVTGSSRSLANKAAEYQRLVLKQEFADKQLAGALASLETARNEAQRQQLYLERVVQPNLPDATNQPKRIRAIVTTFLLSLIVWGIVRLLLAGLREHQE